MSNLRSRYINAFVDALFKDGMEVLYKAKYTKEVQNRFFNLEDAYGCAVYLNGNLVRKGYANNNPISQKEHKGWKKRGIAPNTGRGYLDEFFSNYKPKQKGLELICVNAIFYSSILENGAQSKLKVKYRILSQVDNMFNNLANKYGGVVKDL